MRNPALGPAQRIAAVHVARTCGHAAGVGAVVGLRQPERADQLTARQPRQKSLTLRLAAIAEYRIHHQARLHTHRGAVARIDALDLASDEAIADVVQSGAAVSLDGRAEQPELAHLVEDVAVEAFVAVGFEYPRHELVEGIAVGGLAHQPLFLAELLFEQQRIVPLELRSGLGQHGLAPEASAPG